MATGEDSTTDGKVARRTVSASAASASVGKTKSKREAAARIQGKFAMNLP